ncbi:hypothetical protein [Hasllibacter sp. MH4015]|uniref:hypothetical protein n=1 Tax=Hasllibacter sp. MH4015 TaxID=2854029 RepID=UPI001CD25931|nr:hypothetical protein [Hasllibacter sp. MH4015]
MHQRTALCVAAFLAASATGTANAQDSQRYLTAVLGSVHFGADLNDINPGLLLGHRWHVGQGSFQYHVEAGVLYNSYEEVSPIFMAGVSHGLGTIGPVELRGGISVGTAYYPTLAPILERDYGLPNANGYIPLLVPTLTLTDTRYDNIQYRLTAFPGEDGLGALNLSVAFDF